MSIDMMQLQNGVFEPLIAGMDVPMGQYEWMRLWIDPGQSHIDINHPDCDSAPGGNWAYLFPVDAVIPDDVAEPESDGVAGPLAADRVEMDPATGDHFYHFGFLSPGSYRIAFTCSGEWDEDGDDDCPSDPDGRFDFQMFSDPMDVMAGQMHRIDLMP